MPESPMYECLKNHINKLLKEKQDLEETIIFDNKMTSIYDKGVEIETYYYIKRRKIDIQIKELKLEILNINIKELQERINLST